MRTSAWLCCALAFGLGLAQKSSANPDQGARVTELAIEGEIRGENIIFTLSLACEPLSRAPVVPLVAGDVTWLDGTFPRGATLEREGDAYRLRLGRRGGRVVFRFAGRAAREGDWRRADFRLPAATVRRLGVTCDRNDLDVRFAGALNVERGPTPDGRMRVSANLGLGDRFNVSWKPQVRRLDSELVVASEAHVLATAGVGALRIDSLLTYRVVQGELTRLTLRVPAPLNVTQVGGADIQEWRLEREDAASQRLIVTLSRPQTSVYRLRVECDMPLSAFPSRFSLPVLAPQQVIRGSGFLLLGADSAVRLQVDKAAGLTQIDQASFPMPPADDPLCRGRVRPSRHTYAYQYANPAYTLDVGVDDIVTTLMTEDRLVVTLDDRDVSLQAGLELDVRDAAAREVLIDVDADPAWTVTAVQGAQVAEADTDVREENGRRVVVVPFRQAVVGTTLVNLRLERTLPPGTNVFDVPRVSVRGARSERGFVSLAASRGARLQARLAEGLHEAHTGSLPQQPAGAQQAFRFRAPDWRLVAAIERTAPTLHAEVFHLLSLGDGVLYGSVAMTFHVAGAPVQDFRIQVPESLETFDLTGADIESWSRTGGVCTVRLQKKSMGDYTLLLTYDRQYAYPQAEIEIGTIEMPEVESESGYLVVASSASLKLTEVGSLPAAVIPIARGEIPTAYSAPIGDPILRAYKYVRAPHVVRLRADRLPTGELLGQVIDYAQLSTTLGSDGEAVTTARYFVKNASRQHLALRLPPGARLWAMREVAEDGALRAVPAQESEGRILTPVSRPRDPNTALAIEAVYAARPARDLRRLLGGRLELRAPELPETHAAFVSWTVTAPPRRGVAASADGVVGRQRRWTTGWGDVCGRALRLAVACWEGGSARRLRAALTGATAPVTREFTRPVRRAGEEAPSLSVAIVPLWLAADGDAPLMVLACVIGVVLVSAGLWRGRRAVLAPGLAALAVAAGQTGPGRATLAVCLFGLVLLALLGGAGIAIGRAIARLRQWRSRRRAPSRDDALPLEPAEPPPSSSTGGLAGLILCLTLGLISAAQAGEAAPPPADAMRVREVEVELTAPGAGRETERSAVMRLVLKGEFERAGEQALLAPDAVLLDYATDWAGGEVVATPDGYRLRVARRGVGMVRLTCRVPVREAAGRWSVSLPLPPSLRNRTRLEIPETGLVVESPDAVLLETREEAGRTRAEVSFHGRGPVTLAWQPRVRATRLEKAVFFADMSTLATLQAGLLEAVHAVRYQIAQGELRELRLTVPAGMNVTAVRGPGLATWSFDPATRSLEAVLEQPVSGEYELTLVTQVPREGLPYAVVVLMPRVQDTPRQRGALAIAAPESLQVRVDEVRGLSPMNIEDFSLARPAASSAVVARAAQAMPPVRRAFRYQSPDDVSLRVQAEAVSPELRVIETGALSIADERISLATRLELTVLKAGVFGVALRLPPDYDLESLTGRQVSHWDEDRRDGRIVNVHFNRQITDAADLNLVLSRTEKGVEDRLRLPRVTVIDARRHTGKLTVSTERGVRLMVEAQQGVDLRKSSEEGVLADGGLVFELLRPEWSVILRTEPLTPVIKPEVLHWVDVSEGMLRGRAFIHYRIEQAGVKTLWLRAPAPGVALAVAGRGVARVRETDAGQGLWQVDLHTKVEQQFSLNVTYQTPFAPELRQASVRPLRTEGTDESRGYLVVTCSGRVEVAPVGSPVGLTVDDPRGIPAGFRAGDLSHAVLCYRTIRPDFSLDLSVVRHGAAGVLPAGVREAQLTSVLAPGGDLLTRLRLALDVGELRFLRVRLPRAEDRLWTLLVNGRSVQAARDGDLYLVPLEEQTDGQATSVELVYLGGPGDRAGWLGREYQAPSVGLPLRDVRWDVYAPDDRLYFGLGGDMDPADAGDASSRRFDAARYLAWNRAQREQAIEKARAGLDTGEELIRSGRPREARRALQTAYHYSQAEAELNEDARVQLRNVLTQQFKMGLVNRRDNMRYARNIIDDETLGQMRGFQDGDFTREYAAHVAQRLEQRDNQALDAVAGKLIDQQTAAAGVVSAIHVAIPEHGRRLSFSRPLHVDADAGLSIRFRAVGRAWTSAAGVLGVFLAGVGALAVGMRCIRRRRAV